LGKIKVAEITIGMGKVLVVDMLGRPIGLTTQLQFLMLKEAVGSLEEQGERKDHDQQVTFYLAICRLF